MHRSMSWVASLGSQTREGGRELKGKLIKAHLMMSAKMKCASFLGLTGWVLFSSLKSSQISFFLSGCMSWATPNCREIREIPNPCILWAVWFKALWLLEGLISFEDSGKTLQSCIWPSGMKSGSARISLTGLKVDKSAHNKDRRLETGCTSAEYLIPLTVFRSFPSLYLLNVLDLWIVPCLHHSLNHSALVLLFSPGPNCLHLWACFE